MRQQGEIIKIEGSQAWVKFMNPSAACGNCKGCIRLTSREQEKEKIIKLDFNINAAVGDTVMIEYPSRGIFQAMLVLYGLPFLGLFLGYFLTYSFTKDDAVSALVAVVSLILCGALARPLARRLDQRIGKPHIVTSLCQTKPLEIS